MFRVNVQETWSSKDADFVCIVRVIPSLLTVALTLAVHVNHINSLTIDLYLDGKSPKFSFRVDDNENFKVFYYVP